MLRYGVLTTRNAGLPAGSAAVPFFTRTSRPTPGRTNSPVFIDRTASAVSFLATFLGTPRVLAALAAEGKPVAIFT